MTEKNQQIVLASRPEGMPGNENFEYQETSIVEPQDGEILVKTIYLSVDPYMRGRMSSAKSYVAPFEVNEVIHGNVVGEVVQSKSSLFETGDKVIGMLGWRRYNTVGDASVRKIDGSAAPLSTYLGILGLTGLTAYFGLLDIGRPAEGETVVVSGAAGAVGMVAGQIAKLRGARVVGIAGTDKKTEYLKSELRFNETINYNTTDDLVKSVKQACPEGVDVYFDNVGGPVSDAVMTQLNDFARIPVCGAISSYNKTEEDVGQRVQPTLVKSRALIQGFIVGDYAPRFQEGSEKLATWLSEGKLKYEETIVEGFENIPKAFLGLFSGENLGKQLVKVSEPTE
ncbi:NADPH-dependent curcumin reductase CurA [Salibacterium salarium]|uniref:NADP-dependent oxidoreductase n=1 Tax=Salibacterium salarium TaxID=284579 RepID=UPI0027856C58|nr:NADP-dependent oxidoreductase [Salibacterium salarium]MDQ0298330.1 NADPH-dependent curcumin reductase CurA [Salibacterium salarium]